MNVKHLASGSLCPSMTEGLLRIYSMRYCPFAERTLLVLHAKGVNYELVNVNLRQKPEWLKEKNPLTKVPILEFGKNLISESIHTCDFLEETYPEPSLYPSDPWQKFSEKALVDYFGEKIISPMVRLMFRFNIPEKATEHLKHLKEGYKLFEEELLKKNTPFYGGYAPKMVDYMLWPWFERIPMLETVLQNELFSKEECPALKKYMEEMKKDHTVKAISLTTEQHLQYLYSVLNGEFKYDFTEPSKL